LRLALVLLATLVACSIPTLWDWLPHRFFFEAIFGLLGFGVGGGAICFISGKRSVELFEVLGNFAVSGVIGRQLFDILVVNVLGHFLFVKLSEHRLLLFQPLGLQVGDLLCVLGNIGIKVVFGIVVAEGRVVCLTQLLHEILHFFGVQLVGAGFLHFLLLALQEGVEVLHFRSFGVCWVLLVLYEVVQKLLLVSCFHVVYELGVEWLAVLNENAHPLLELFLFLLELGELQEFIFVREHLLECLLVPKGLVELVGGV